MANEDGSDQETPVDRREPGQEASSRRSLQPVNKKVIWVKTSLQKFIGFVVFALIALRTMVPLYDEHCPGTNLIANIFCYPASWTVGGQDFVDANVLAIVGAALAYSAAIELAYMLFTPGPDEAVDPIILGMAAVVLSVAARTDTLLKAEPPSRFLIVTLGITLLVAAIALSFYVRARLLNPTESEARASEAAQAEQEQIRTIRVEGLTANISSTVNHRIHFSNPFKSLVNRKG